MKYDIGLCDTTQQAMNFEQVISTPVLWIGICVMIFSFISFVLVCKAMCSTYNTLKKMKTDKLFRNYSTYGSFKPKPPSTPIPNEKKSVLFASDGEEIITVPKNMEKLSFWEKLSFFNPWHPITLASSLMAFLSSIMTLCNLTYRFITLTPTNITLGISAIMVWTNLVQYLAHAPKFYVLITALRFEQLYVINTSVRLERVCPTLFDSLLVPCQFWLVMPCVVQSCSVPTPNMYAICSFCNLYIVQGYASELCNTLFLGQWRCHSWYIWHDWWPIHSDCHL